jgi:hypothetical protein
LIERVGQRARKISRLAARHQMHDDFGVTCSLEDGPAMFERAAPLRGARQVAIVSESELSLIAVDHNRLRIHQRSVSGGGISCVAQSRVTGKPRQNLGLKDIRHQAHAFFEMQFAPIARNDAGRFLAAMLQSVKSKVC